MRPYLLGTILIVLALAGYGIGLRASAVAIGIIGAAFLIADAVSAKDPLP